MQKQVVFLASIRTNIISKLTLSVVREKVIQYSVHQPSLSLGE